MKLHQVVVLAAAAALGVAGVAIGSGPEPGSATTIRATLFYTGLTLVDTDHNGKPSVGDMAIAPGFYVNSAGKRIGTVGASCLQITAASSSNCTDYSHFAGGDIITADRFSLTEKTFHEAILGGTGVYAGLTGTVNGRWLKPDFSKAQVVFNLHR
jgi:hypothetical protein